MIMTPITPRVDNIFKVKMVKTADANVTHRKLCQANRNTIFANGFSFLFSFIGRISKHTHSAF